jgi:hypothetical protein
LENTRLENRGTAAGIAIARANQRNAVVAGFLVVSIRKS